jgi:hypothetical protein
MNDWCGEHAMAIQMYEPEVANTDIKINNQTFDECIAAMSVGVAEIPDMTYDIATDSYKPKRKYTRKEKQ